MRRPEKNYKYKKEKRPVIFIDTGLFLREVGEGGVEPPVFLVSQIYSLLPSPLGYSPEFYIFVINDFYYN